MKRFAVHYSGNRDHSHTMPKSSTLPMDDEFYGSASTLKTAKRYISEIRKLCADQKPHNFRIYDMRSDVCNIYRDACVYQRD